MLQGRRFSVPLEELDDDAWTVCNPHRPKRYAILGEWTSPSWSFEVKEGWQDYDDPPFEVQEVEQRKPRQQKARPPKHDDPWIDAAIASIQKPKRKKKRKVRPPVADQYEEVLKYWAMEQPAEVRWNGSPNRWAQACFYCSTVVAVGQGTYGKTKHGDWTASHWDCLTNREKKS